MICTCESNRPALGLCWRSRTPLGIATGRGYSTRLDLGWQDKQPEVGHLCRLAEAEVCCRSSCKQRTCFISS